MVKDEVDSNLYVQWLQYYIQLLVLIIPFNIVGIDN